MIIFIIYRKLMIKMNYSYSKNKSNKLPNIGINSEWLWFSIVFLFALNFWGKGHYLLICLFLIGFIVIFLKKCEFKFTFDLILIFSFATSYFLILSYYQYTGMFSIIIYLIGPIACFSIGYFIISPNNKLFERTILAVIFGLFLHGFFNMINYFQVYGINSIDGARTVPDIWTGINIAATLQGTYFSLISSLLFYSIILMKQRAYLFSNTIITCIIFSLISSFMLGNRTLIYILIISLIVNLLTFVFLNKLKINELVKVGSLVAILSLIVSLVFINNAFGLKEFILNSTWYERTESSELMEDSRFLIYQVAFNQMFDFPLGGHRMSFTYAHNLWLDVLHATGLIPFFFLLLYTLVSFKNIMGILISSRINIEKKVFFVSIYVGFILTFMVEPILEAVPFMFLMFILFNGMTKKIIDINNQAIGQLE